MKHIFSTIALLFCAHSYSADPVSIINAAPDSCVDWKITGVCLSGPRVEHYIAVAYVEVMHRLQRTLLDTNIPPLYVRPFSIGGQTAAGAIGQSSASYANNTSEASALNVSKVLWETSRHALLRKGLMCSFETALSPLTAAELNSAWEQIAPSSNCSTPDPLGFYGGDLLQLMTRGYSTSGDVDQWRTGCRDKGAMNAIMDGGIKCRAGQNEAGTGQGACIGNWGTLYPRQMREIGLDPLTASAKTAHRALSNGRSTGHIPFPVDMSLRYSQTSPSTSQCFGPGTYPLPTTIAGAGKPVTVSPSGEYGYLVWRKVSCCTSPSKFLQ